MTVERERSEVLGCRDEGLVELSQNGTSPAARDELILRYYPALRRIIASHMLNSGTEDREDLQQDGVFWIVEAIDRYRPVLRGKRTCTFRTFVGRVVASRLIDSIRRRASRARHNKALRSEAPPAGDAADAGAALEEQERAAAVARALDTCDGSTQELWALLLDGIALREAAALLGDSYDAAKRRRQRSLVKLRACLAEWQPGG